MPKQKDQDNERGTKSVRSLFETEGVVTSQESPRRPEASGSNHSSGTGFFIDREGHLLTAHHVVDKKTRYRIRLGDGKMISAGLVKVDMSNDVAVLKADYRPSRWLECAKDSKISLGQAVFTIGFPNADIQGIEPKFNDGRISALSGIRDDPRHWQTSIPATNGNSGGPLLDGEGKVIGLIVHKLNDLMMLERSGNVGQSVSYALKVDYLTSLLPSSAATSYPFSSASSASPHIDPAVIDRVRPAVVLLLAE